jgi:hypothetical protein
MAAVLDQVQGQMDALQSLYTQSDITRVMVEDKIDDLARAITKLAERREAGGGGDVAAALARIAEGQERLIAAVTSDGEGAMGADAESRMRLRSIDVQLLKILEEMSAGRQESLADLRADIASLTAAIRQLSRSAPAGRG